MKPPVSTRRPPPASATPSRRVVEERRGTAGFFAAETTPLVIDRHDVCVHALRARRGARPDDRKRNLDLHDALARQPSTRGVEYFGRRLAPPPQSCSASSDGKPIRWMRRPASRTRNSATWAWSTEHAGDPSGADRNNGLSSPPVVYQNLVITGGRTQEGPPARPGR